MKTKSVWGKPPDRIYKLTSIVNEKFKNPRVCIVGCSDGKFVLPFARKNIKVVGYDIDSIAIYGGVKRFPISREVVRKKFVSYEEMMNEKFVDSCGKEVIGLLNRLEIENVSNIVEIRNEDFYGQQKNEEFDLVFTSCSLHYKNNLKYGIDRVVKRLKESVKLGGYIYIDYMMPLRDSYDFMSELFLRTGQMKKYFKNDEWDIISYREQKNPVFEAAHVDCLRDHFHRFGYFFARRIK